MKLQRGDILADDDDKDGWMVTAASRLEVTLVDLVLYGVWRWRMHGDGIRVRRAVWADPKDPDDFESEWKPMAITLYPPPEEVGAHLRSGKR